MSEGLVIKRTIPPIENDAVRLRLLQPDDLPLTLAWRNQDHIRRWFFYSDKLTPEQHQGWFEKYRQRDDDFVFIIESLELARSVGQVALYGIDWEKRRAEFGRLMIGDPAAAGKGLAQSATRLALQVGIETLGLDEIYLEVFADNSAAIKVYEKAGFAITEKRPDVWIMTYRNSTT
jgi:diamine N-acetyltransferase